MIRAHGDPEFQPPSKFPRKLIQKSRFNKKIHKKYKDTLSLTV